MTIAEHVRPESSATPSPARALPDSDPDAAFARWVESHRLPILIVAALASIFWIVLYLQFTVDDAYISFRYGLNLVIHHVWNWNPSGPHEEAYTSAIYTFLGIIPALLRLSPALFFKFVGAACLGVTVYRLRTLTGTPFAALLGVLLLAVHPYLWMHAFSGLETPLYMLLILEMAIAAHRAATTSPAWAYTLFLLLPLTRPEGIVFAFAGVLLFWQARGSAPKRLAWFALAIFLGVVYFLARWHYFHHLFPNPFYAKIHAGTWRGVARCLAANLINSDGYFFILLLLFLLARRPVTRIFSACSFLTLLLVFAPNAVQMNFADRFYLQLTFPIFFLFLIAEDAAPVSRIAAIVAGISLLLILPANLIYGATNFLITKRSHIDLGRRLAPFAQDHVLFAGAAGAIPYYSGWVTYDFLGLGTNRFMAPAITLSQMEHIHPDVIVIFGDSAGPEAAEESEKAGSLAVNPLVLAYMRQSNDYQYAGAARADGFYLVSFLRNDTPQHDQILAALQQNTEISARTDFSLKSLLLQRYVPWSQ
jgi:hypothetical protein